MGNGLCGCRKRRQENEEKIILLGNHKAKLVERTSHEKINSNEAQKTSADPQPARAQQSLEEGHKRINEYVLIKTIGKGTYSKVKLAQSQKDGQMYAIKVLNKARLRKKRTVGMHNALSDVLREVEIHSQMTHKNIIRLFKVIDVEAEDMLYLVLELMEAGPLLDNEFVFPQVLAPFSNQR